MACSARSTRDSSDGVIRRPKATREDRQASAGFSATERFSNRAIADAQGNVILANPAPGQLGTLGQRWIEGPSHVGLDANLVKRVRIAENKEFEVRIDAINVLNTPRWQDPVTDINSPNFGRMTAAVWRGERTRRCGEMPT